MRVTIARGNMQTRLTATFAAGERLSIVAADTPLPANLEAWLSNLQLLQGVPFNYLVPDEGMLPPESIRFFYLDLNWMDALNDGAYSIGRNLTAEASSPTLALDAASQPLVRRTLSANAAALRAKNLGQPAPQTKFTVVTGFLLRSALVKAYPGLGIYAYDAQQGKLKILRFERLGDGSDTLLCLLDGDAERIDLHEAPEALHYGIDSYAYDAAAGLVTALKIAHEFTITGETVTLEPDTVDVDISSCFRADAPRTMRMARLAATLAAKANPALPYLDAAQMGFEMTQGVGLVSFTRSTQTP